jgi:hypothetical protein
MTLIEMAKQIEKYESERLCLVADTSYLMAIIRSQHGVEAGKIVGRLNYLSDKESTDTKRNKLWAEIETALQNYQKKPTVTLMPGVSTGSGMMPGLN